MKQGVTFLVISLLLACSLISCTAKPQEPFVTGSIQWETNYKHGIKNAEETGKPYFLYFTANWCGWCKQLNREVFGHDTMATTMAMFIPIAINVDTNAQVAQDYQVRGIPALFFVSPDGKIKYEYQGDRSIEDLTTKMKTFLVKLLNK